MEIHKIQGTKYVWHIPEYLPQEVLDIAVAYNLSTPLCHTLLVRGFSSKAQIDSYLFSSHEQDVSPSHLMKDALKSVERINLAIERQEKILIFGDYDVDGITSSSLMMACLLPLGAQVNFYLPNRAKEGYGLSTKVVERAAQNNYKVIITVDNGTTAFEPARVAKSLGVDLIITDHHRPHGELPDSFSLVNPHQEGCEYPFKEFAGVGVTFKVLSLLYEQRGLPLPSKAYELLLLGTVADVVPLQGENRFWVRHGLQAINAAPSLSFNVLKGHGKVTNPLVSATDIGYRIAPQINALGRLEDPRQGVKFLLGSDVAETERVGAILNNLNQMRKEIERGVFEEVQALIQSGRIDLSQENVIVAASNAWPTGVIGLVASRLVGEYARPTLLFHLTKDGKAKGSCRSIAAFNMFEALQTGSHLIDQFGGHTVAAGLSLPAENVALLKEHLEARTREFLKPEDFHKVLRLDGTLTLADVNQKLVKDMQFFHPFGAQNSEPAFLLKNVTVIQKPQLLKDSHVKCTVFADGVVKPLIFFNRPDIYEMLMVQEGAIFDVAVQISENHWQGRVSVELMGLDIAGVRYS